MTSSESTSTATTGGVFLQALNWNDIADNGFVDTSTGASTTTTTDPNSILWSLPQVDEGVLLYRALYPQNVTRLPNAVVDSYETAQTGDSGPVLLYHVIAMLPFSDVRPDHTYSSSYPKTAAAYEDAAAVALALHHLNTGGGGGIDLVPGLADVVRTCPIGFTLEFLDTQSSPGTTIDQMFGMVTSRASPSVMVQTNQQDEDSTVQQQQQSTSTGNNNNNVTSSLQLLVQPSGFLGPLASAIALPTSLLTGHKGMVQVAPSGSSNTDLDDKEQYPLFGRTIPSDGQIVRPILKYFTDVMDVWYLVVLSTNDAFGNSFGQAVQLAASEMQYDIDSGSNNDDDDDDSGGGGSDNGGDNTLQILRLVLDVDGQNVNAVLDELERSTFRYVLAAIGQPSTATAKMTTLWPPSVGQDNNDDDGSTNNNDEGDDDGSSNLYDDAAAAVDDTDLHVALLERAVLRDLAGNNKHQWFFADDPFFYPSAMGEIGWDQGDGEDGHRRRRRRRRGLAESLAEAAATRTSTTGTSMDESQRQERHPGSSSSSNLLRQALQGAGVFRVASPGTVVMPRGDNIDDDNVNDDNVDGNAGGGNDNDKGGIHTRYQRFEEQMRAIHNPTDLAYLDTLIPHPKQRHGVANNVTVSDEQIKRSSGLRNAVKNMLNGGGERGRLEDFSLKPNRSSYGRVGFFDRFFAQGGNQYLNDPILGSDTFLNPGWLETASFAYDATILMGLSACKAALANKGGPFSGRRQFEILTRDAIFDGVAGKEVLDHLTGSRIANSTVLRLDNVLSVLGDVGNATGTASSSNVPRLHRIPSNAYQGQRWYQLQHNFVYTDGSTQPPPDLPPPEDVLSYVKPGIRAFSYALCAISVLLAMGFAAWTFRNRKTRVVRASQPFFLYLICFGVTLVASSTITISFDTQFSTIEACSKACSATLWLFFSGIALIFSALFTKTFRINLIMRSSQNFKRVRVTILDTVKPMVVLLTCNIIILSVMQVKDPTEYVIAALTTDRFGRPTSAYGICNFHQQKWYIVAAATLNFCILLLSVYQSWMARHLSTEFAESKSIFRALDCILLVTFVGAPVLLLSRDSPDTTTFVVAAMNFVICMSILLFIFVPKIRFSRRTNDRKGSNIQVSGLNDTPTALDAASGAGMMTTGGMYLDSEVTVDEGGADGGRTGPSSSSSSSSSLYGERIVTTETAEKLARRVQNLERILILAEKRERERQGELEALRKQLIDVAPASASMTEQAPPKSSVVDLSSSQEQLVDVPDASSSKEFCDQCGQSRVPTSVVAELSDDADVSKIHDPLHEETKPLSSPDDRRSLESHEDGELSAYHDEFISNNPV